MAISKLEVGAVPLGVGGDSLRSAAAKINANFSDTTHAASKLVGTGAEQVPLSKDIPSLLGTAATRNVGTATGNVMEVGAFGLGRVSSGEVAVAGTPLTTQNGFIATTASIWELPYVGYGYKGLAIGGDSSGSTVLTVPFASSDIVNQMGYHFTVLNTAGVVLQTAKIYTNKNTTIVNGSLKPSSPVVKIHTDSLELNDDAERMGVILNKRGVGDYLLQNTTGLRNDGGWRIELPQDVNGNPYFAVDYNELENNDIEVKTYKRIFDMNTFMFVPDLDNPVDIKEGRSIAIRFNDLPQDDTQTED